MNQRIKVGLGVAIAVGLFFSADGFSKSSEIPAKREFPVNPEISPCKDFYEHSCSKVIDTFELREDRSRHVFSFNDSTERILEAKKAYLKEIAAKPSGALSDRAQTLATVYSACMNVDAAKNEERELVKKGLREMFSIADRDELLNFSGKQTASPEYGFLSFGTIANLDDSAWEDVYFVGTLQSMPERSYYDKPEVMEDYIKLLKLFFTTVKLDNPDGRARKILEFEKRFATTYPLPVEWRDIANKKSGITRAELEKKYPTFRLTSILKRIPAKTHIRNMTPENYEQLEAMLNDAPLDTLKDIWLYRSLSSKMDDAYPEFFQASFDFSKKHLGGPPKRADRDERCTKMVMGSFEREIDAELLPKMFPNFPEQRVRKIVERVRATIVRGLDNNKWLEAKTREVAKKKISSATLQIVRPKTNREWDFNPKLTYSKETPYENMRKLSQALIDKEIRELYQPRDRARWVTGPLTVNAYYSPQDNKFVMPIGILQPPFFDPSLPDEAGLGAVGMVVGHELGHAIDDKGGRYDEKGNLVQWFSEKDFAEFKRRTMLLVDQFNLAGHNGELTLGENIGDLVGLTFAFQTAFDPTRKVASAKPSGPSEDELKRQFFYSYARVWCNVTRPKAEELQLKTDPHALGRARVNEQIKQQPEFARVFGCQAHDPQNPQHPMVLSPEKRVEIW